MTAVQRDIPTLIPVLEEWLRTKVGGKIAITGVIAPKSGMSSETYLVDVAIDGRPAQWVLRIEASAYQVYQDPAIERQYRILEVLSRTGEVLVPGVLWYEGDASVLGKPFFFMERVSGVAPPEDYHSHGVLMDAAPAERERMWQDAVRNLATVHKADPAPFGFLDQPELGPIGIQQELARWDGFREWTGLPSVPVFDRGRRWLEDNHPGSTPPGLAWGDARPVNMMFEGGRCMGVLDWETASLGGAESDIGWWLYYDYSQTAWLGVPRAEGIGDRAALIALWEQEVGRKAQAMEWHEVFATWRFGWIIERAVSLFSAIGATPPPDESGRHNPAIRRMEELLAEWG